MLTAVQGLGLSEAADLRAAYEVMIAAEVRAEYANEEAEAAKIEAAEYARRAGQYPK